VLMSERGKPKMVRAARNATYLSKRLLVAAFDAPTVNQMARVISESSFGEVF